MSGDYGGVDGVGGEVSARHDDVGVTCTLTQSLWARQARKRANSRLRRQVAKGASCHSVLACCLPR